MQSNMTEYEQLKALEVREAKKQALRDSQLAMMKQNKEQAARLLQATKKMLAASRVATIDTAEYR